LGVVSSDSATKSAMQRATGYRVGPPFGAGFFLGLALCLTLGICAANSAEAQANRPRTAEESLLIGSLEHGEAVALDRVAFAVEGAESSHGADPRMWGPDLNGPQGPMQVSAAAALDAGGGDRFEERENRALGRAYLAQMYRRYGSWPDAVAAYNWGPGHMDSWISGGRPFEKFPPAVEIYRTRVLFGSSLGMLRRGFVRLQPRRPAADPHNGRAAVERLYPEIMGSSELGNR
jgi:Transglycosylase SLT domain